MNPKIIASLNQVEECFRRFVSSKRELKHIGAQGVGCESYRLDFTGFNEAEVYDALARLRIEIKAASEPEVI